MKVFILKDVLCDYTCGCIIVAAKNRKKAADIIKMNHGSKNEFSNIENDLEEVIKGYYFEVCGGG